MNRTVKHCIVHKHAYIHIIHKYKSLKQQLHYQYQCQHQQRQTVTRTMDKTIREKSSSEQKHSAHNTRVSSRTKILFARNAMNFFGIFNTNLFTWRVMYIETEHRSLMLYATEAMTRNFIQCKSAIESKRRVLKSFNQQNVI